MSIMWVYDIYKEDEEDIELKKRAEELTKRENELKNKALDIVMNMSQEEIDKHIPRLD